MYDDDVKEDQYTSLVRENQELHRKIEGMQQQLQLVERPLLEMPSSALVGDWAISTPGELVLISRLSDCSLTRKNRTEVARALAFTSPMHFNFLPTSHSLSHLEMSPNPFFQRLHTGAAFADTRHLNALICASPSNAYEQYVQSFGSFVLLCAQRVVMTDVRCF